MKKEEIEFYDDEIDLFEYVSLFWRRKWLIISITLICCSVAVFYALYVVEEIFESKTLPIMPINAKILSDKQSPFLKSIVINRGSKHKINLGMAVMDGEYLIGKIVEVNYGTSRVLLLSDLNSKIPVIIEPGGTLSILSGTGKEEGVIQYSKKENLTKGLSIVYTSGSSGLFKSGIPVGKINGDSITTKKTVKFFSDFSQLEFVTIVKFKKADNQ